MPRVPVFQVESAKRSRGSDQKSSDSCDRRASHPCEVAIGHQHWVPCHGIARVTWQTVRDRLGSSWGQ